MISNNRDIIYVNGKPKEKVIDASCLNPYHSRNFVRKGDYSAGAIGRNFKIQKRGTTISSQDIYTD